MYETSSGYKSLQNDNMHVFNVVLVVFRLPCDLITCVQFNRPHKVPRPPLQHSQVPTSPIRQSSVLQNCVTAGRGRFLEASQSERGWWGEHAGGGPAKCIDTGLQGHQKRALQAQAL